ncbi:MAG: hypothetical protein V4677_03050, partial [Bacteroidota bacterium]
MSYFVRRDVIHPEDTNEVKYWTKKWDVNVRQIYDAILETGSVKLTDIRKALHKNEKPGSLLYWKHTRNSRRISPNC